ncbi:hypothetical protein BV20DRAFT_1050262 [Pilatotrama ljubarskyi]|nr:hypothetical protein BV20DRAFT_1050262 [Pilatotrama ljubarskyi]
MLRNASIAWLLDEHTFFCNNSDAVQKAWEDCKVTTPLKGTLDLSHMSIMSNESTSHSQALYASDPALHHELAKFQFSAITRDPELNNHLDTSATNHDNDLSVDMDMLTDHCANHRTQNSDSDLELITADPTAEADFIPLPPDDFHPASELSTQCMPSLSSSSNSLKPHER